MAFIEAWPLNPLPYKVYWEFADGAAIEAVWATLELPADYDSGDVEVFIWTERPLQNTGTTATTRWGFDAYIAQRPAAGAGNAIGIPAQNGEVTLTHASRSELYVSLPFTWTIYTGWRYAQRDSLGTFTPNAAGDLCKVKIYRDPTDGDDTYAHSMALFMVEFVYDADS
jgi:hypothetical protein